MRSIASMSSRRSNSFIANGMVRSFISALSSSTTSAQSSVAAADDNVAAVMAALRWRCSSLRQGSGLAAGFLAGLCDGGARGSRHQAGIVHDGDEAEAHADRARGIGRAAAVNAGVDLALVALLENLVVQRQDFRLVAVEPRRQTIGETEIRRADVDAGHAIDV